MSLLQRAILGRRVGRLVLEQLNDFDLVILPDVFNPAVFRTTPLLLESVVAHVGGDRRVLDVGTGSGALAIQAAACGARVTAVDINPEAIRCARINATLNRVDDRVDLREGDLFEPLGGEMFDVVVCNPPFFQGTPGSALDAAWRSRDFLARFCGGLESVVAPGGCALVVFSNHADERGLLARLASWRVAVDRSRALRNETITVYRILRRER
ncbi:MAG TPA: methyltransferase [Vicinamibacterales bacterium]|nr:methyltransferase [Vicinamibacterales bacterium]